MDVIKNSNNNDKNVLHTVSLSCKQENEMQMIKNNNLKDTVWQSIADQWESRQVVAALCSQLRCECL